MAVISRKQAENGGAKDQGSAVKADVEPVKAVETVEPRASLTIGDSLFRLEHPDCTRSFRPSGEFSLQVGDAVHQISLIDGVIETPSNDVKTVLVSRGYRVMNGKF